jgi:hypothetical protein
MFNRARVIAALEAKREAFAGYELRAGQDLERYAEALDWLSTRSREQVLQQLANSPGLAPVDDPQRAAPRAGALPTAERVAGQAVLRPFGPRWANHQEARAWALAVLQGVTTLAVDGSQVTPSRDFSIPVGAVQVGWFENTHDAATGGYTKDIRFEVLPPEELAGEAQDTGRFPDLLVNLRRFELECTVLVEAMRRLAGRRPAPVCFFDGSLILSFAARINRPALQCSYLAAMRSLLGTSEETHVPLVGYVDTSHARDLVTMLYYLLGYEQEPSLSDGALLRNKMHWGDRTEVLVCARDDGLFDATNAALDYYHRVHFCYVKTTSANAPVRLDLPAWLLEAGELDRVIDIVRAECIVGTGYPYVVETADAVAVITNEDRERFYRTFQEFVAGLGVGMQYSRKAYSKRGRR